MYTSFRWLAAILFSNLKAKDGQASLEEITVILGSFIRPSKSKKRHERHRSSESDSEKELRHHSRFANAGWKSSCIS